MDSELRAQNNRKILGAVKLNQTTRHITRPTHRAMSPAVSASTDDSSLASTPH
jgi:hypothetical protein